MLAGLKVELLSSSTERLLNSLRQVRESSLKFLVLSELLTTLAIANTNLINLQLETWHH